MQSIVGRPLSELLLETQGQVRKEPAQAKHRIFLFQLLCVLGQWDRALNQLNVLSEIDASSLAMVQTYRQALQSEAYRVDVFCGRRMPLIFGEPERWIALLLEALRLGAEGKFSEAAAIRAEAFDLAPATPGRFDDPKPDSFAWIADADQRLGPMLEAVIDGKYYWVPFARISALRIEPPQDLRDLVWVPGFFRWSNGGESAGLIPTRYCGSESSEDDRILRASRTEWLDAGEGIFTGLGQRMLATDVDEYSLLDLRGVVLDQVAEQAGS